MKAASIPEEAIPTLVEALRDPETQVRANAAHALARLDALPAEAVTLLIGCTADSYDGLRMNAAVALELAPASAVVEVMLHLVADPNPRIRLIAAGTLLSAEPDNPQARRRGGGPGRPGPAHPQGHSGTGRVPRPGRLGFLDALKDREGLEDEAESRITLTRIIERLENLAGPVPRCLPPG